MNELFEKILTDALKQLQSIEWGGTKNVRDLIMSTTQRISDELGISAIAQESIERKKSQNLRNEVLEMVHNRWPLFGIKKYRWFREDGDAKIFFINNYSKYTQYQYEVIFAPDLKKIDERLLNALRNLHRKDMPLWSVEDRTNAIVWWRFIDDKKSLKRALVSVDFRERRATQ